jgi:perosamine synthetase
MDTVETAAAAMMGAPYNSIGTAEYAAIGRMFLGDPERPLSGYLAGKERGGVYVQALEAEWAETFEVKHAIACNSATSGLMAAAFAAGLKHGDKFSVSPMTMSATAAAPMFTGAHPVFCDVEEETFGYDELVMGSMIKATFVTNMFGHPAQLKRLRAQCDALGRVMIEDNAQAPFAMEGAMYAGTIGHIGVFSLNVHKHFHCGEGGVIVTNNDAYADAMRAFINHGEHMSFEIGLNLRMPEICAAIALTQLRKGQHLVNLRVAQALDIIEAIGPLPDGIRHPVSRQDCTHSFYIIPWLIERDRTSFLNILHDQGVPVVEGYQEPLYRMPAFARMKRKDGCPIAEDLQDRRLFHIENCAYTFSTAEIKKIGDAFRRAADAQASCRV